MEYGLIGEKLGHSFSPLIHRRLASYRYDLVPLNREEFVSFMKAKEFRGINVTIPYKKDVIPYLDEMDEAARAIGAVNTIVNRGGRLCGYNTDCPGFLYMLRRTGIQAAGKKTLVLGSGGAAQAILAALSMAEAGPVICVSRSPKSGAVTYEECSRLHRDARLIVNTTPVGMYPHTGETPLNLTPFADCEAVLDIIYNPAETQLTTQAKSLGIQASTGLSMLVAQAKYACDRFLENTQDDSLIETIMEELKHV